MKDNAINECLKTEPDPYTDKIKRIKEERAASQERLSTISDKLQEQKLMIERMKTEKLEQMRKVQSF